MQNQQLSRHLTGDFLASGYTYFPEAFCYTVIAEAKTGIPEAQAHIAVANAAQLALAAFGK